MHVMIATDGTLDPAKAVAHAAPLAGPSGRVTVFTAVEVPRQLLNELRSETTGDGAPIDAEYVRAQAESDRPAVGWMGDDAFVENYVNRVVATRTGDLVRALTDAGVDVEAVGVENENAARAVLDALQEHEPDVLCVGTHGIGMFEGLLGSFSTKLARLAPCSVLLIR